jgi:hypothetical protein
MLDGNVSVSVLSYFTPSYFYSYFSSHLFFLMFFFTTIMYSTPFNFDILAFYSSRTVTTDSTNGTEYEIF